MSTNTKKLEILRRALWIAAKDVDEKANPGSPCPNPEHCCDPQFIIDGWLRRAENELDVSYGELTYAEEVTQTRLARQSEN
jgi:hypothetical protein